MRRHFAYRGVIPLVILLISIVLSYSVKPVFAIHHLFDFASSLEGWTSNKDASVDNYSFTRQTGSGCPDGETSNGYASLSMSDATIETGAIWMVRQVSDMALESPPSYVDVSFNAKNIEGCAGCCLLAYVGTSAPSSSSGFTSVSSLSNSWTAYTHTVSVNTTAVYAAIGWQAPGTQDNAEVSIDCIHIHFR